ncbi:MAG: hypothetical protein E7487_10640 [Ruminococcaceae bacterium]|nr:hypothetical protein [Oscillospiraceae bacterium]
MKTTFMTAADTARPIRLNENIRQWAWDSLHGKYGDEAMANFSVSVDNVAGFETLSETKKYDIAIRRIAEEAPLRICKEELVSGAATLGEAIHHVVPADYKGKGICSSVSHLTIAYERVLKYGLKDYEERIRKQLENREIQGRNREFLESLQNVVESIKIWHSRYLEAVRKVKPEIYTNLMQVPLAPARNFHEAVQAVWFIFSFVRLCGNWPGIGRIDALLGDYLKKDLESGALTLDRAREILASLFIKGCEWIQSDTPAGSGDAQHYQNIVLAGIDEDGKEITNEVTYLVLDIVEELGISDFPITVRLSSGTPEKLLRRVAEVMKHGGGVVAVYNEEVILKAMTDYGYSLKEARNFANDGCWEVQVPGKTNFSYHPFDSLRILHKEVLKDNTNSSFESFEELYQAYLLALREQTGRILEYEQQKFDNRNAPVSEWRWKESLPCSVVSLFEEDCIGRAASYYEGGAIYNVRSPHIGGAPDTVNSLYAIKKMVFEDKIVTLEELLACLRSNWENREALRLIAKNRYTYYGNDNDEVDELMARLVNDFAAICKELDGRCHINFPAGASTFGRQIEWREGRSATAFGAKKGEILSSNSSATPGTDNEGATALIKSYCKSDLSRMTTGCALDLKILPQVLRGEDGVEGLMGLMRGFLALGGFFMQIDTMDAATLLEAQKNPEKYKTLSVRISGWNARFVTLNEEWQNMIIERTSQGAI